MLIISSSPRRRQSNEELPTRKLARQIPVVADLPVGRNLQDHIYPGGVHFAIDQPLALTQRRIFTIDNIVKYYTKGAGPLASTGVDGLAFVSTRLVQAEQPARDWPDIEMHMVPADVVADGGRYLRHLAGLDERIWHEYYAHYARTPSFSIDPVLLRPKSRGCLKLRSRNPYEHPWIDPNYLSHPHDVATLVEGMRLAIDIGTSQAFRDHFNARLFTKPVPGCEHRHFLSDAYLECVARTLTWTIYHPVGTCKMVASARDPTGVVDSQLRVLGGVRGLRVVDASVMPNIVSGESSIYSGLVIGFLTVLVVEASSGLMSQLGSGTTELNCLTDFARNSSWPHHDTSQPTLTRPS